MLFLKEENELFENFIFLALLGKGSYGSVYKVYDKINKEYFALKEIKINLNHKGVVNEILPFNVQHENILFYSAVLISKRPSKLNFLSCDSSKKRSQPLICLDSASHLESSRPKTYFDIATAKDVLFETQSKIRKFIDRHEIPSTFYTERLFKSNVTKKADIGDLIASLVLKFTEELVFLFNIKKFMGIQDSVYGQVGSNDDFVNESDSLSFKWAEDSGYGFSEDYQDGLRNELISNCLVENKNINNLLDRSIKIYKQDHVMHCKNWRLCGKEKDQSISRNKVYKNRNFYLYLKTSCCDFSLRDYIDFRNHYMFGKRSIEDEASKTLDNRIYFEGSLSNNVTIPIDIYHKGVKNGTTINKGWSLNIFRYILLGLLHLHSLGIAHNDLKCSNIMLDFKHNYMPKIGDFGLRSECRFHRNVSLSQSNFHQKPRVICTHQNDDKIKDCRSLILILYELLYPCKTQSEMHYNLKNLRKSNRVSDEFRSMHPEESIYIEEILSDTNVTAKKILSMYSKISDA